MFRVKSHESDTRTAHCDEIEAPITGLREIAGYAFQKRGWRDRWQWRASGVTAKWGVGESVVGEGERGCKGVRPSMPAEKTSLFDGLPQRG